MILIIEVMIELIKLNTIIILIIIIFRAVGVDQAHGAVDGSAAMDPYSGASGKNLQKVTGGRGDRRGSTTLWERGRTDSNEHFLGVNVTGREEEAVEREARCIMGSSLGL